MEGLITFRQLQVSDRLMESEHSDREGFPPSYYCGHEHAHGFLIDPVAKWCRETFGYSPVGYWDSDANLGVGDGGPDWTGCKSWVLGFQEESHRTAFSLRWDSPRVPLKQLIEGEPEAKKENAFSFARIV